MFLKQTYTPKKIKEKKNIYIYIYPNDFFKRKIMTLKKKKVSLHEWSACNETNIYLNWVSYSQIGSRSFIIFKLNLCNSRVTRTLA